MPLMRFDPFYIADFLLQEWCADPERTAYRGIRRLPPGHLLRFADGEARVHRCTSLPIEPELRLKRPEEYLQQFYTLLNQAIADRVPDDATAILMSGGVDSTSIAALAIKRAQSAGRRLNLRGYTTDYKPLIPDDEDHYAGLVARELAIPLHVSSPASSLPYQDFDFLTLPEPCHDPFLTNNACHYRRIATYSRVLLSGYGGDDVLIGQAWPHFLHLLHRGKFGAIVTHLGGYILKYRKIPPLHGGFRARLRRWMGRAYAHEDFPTWLHPDFVREHQLRERWQTMQSDAHASHPLHPRGYEGLCSNFWASTFEQEDSAYTGAAVELRAPFLDQRVLCFLLRLPPVPWCMDKHILREATRGLLPEEVRLRAKSGLPADPLDAFVLAGRWQPSLQNPAQRLHEFVDTHQIDSALQNSSDLWSDLRPVSLDLWLKNIEKRSPIR
jgi:asparagine synthase (glutamine-hydrolysing)